MLQGVKQIYISECCGSETTKCETKIVDNGRGSTRYYRDTCNKCGAHCHPVLGSLYDSFGSRFLPGDILEVIEDPRGSAWTHNAVFRDNKSERAIGLEIRDLNANNVGMWCMGAPIRNRGPYWQNLDILSDDDLSWYFGSTREEAEEMARRYKK